MSQSIAAILLSLLILLMSLLIAKRIEKWGLKILIFALGALAAGIILFYPSLPNTLSLARSPTDAEILLLLYGPEVEIQESPNGKSIFILEQLSEIEKEQFHYASQVNTQIIHKRGGWRKDPHLWIVLTETGPPDCCDQSFLPVLGCAIIAREEGTWQVVLHQKLIVPLHTFDFIPEGEFVEIGHQKPGFRLQDRVTINGRTQTWDLIIAEIDGHLKPVAKIETLANNQAQCPPIGKEESCWESTSKYNFVASSQSDYYDILVTTSGTRLVNETPVPFTEITKYIFENSVYRFAEN